MTRENYNDLWRDFPKTATEFEARFATEEDCRAYWIEARWGGEPACARCGSKRVWTIRGGTTFECADCDPRVSSTCAKGRSGSRSLRTIEARSLCSHVQAVS